MVAVCVGALNGLGNFARDIRKDEEEKKAPRFKPEWEVGETVRVLDGPFADFNGVIEDINIDQSKVRVLVDIFGRETPVELNFEQIQKF